MTSSSPEVIDIFKRYERIVQSGALEKVQRECQWETRKSVYSLAVVVWLMILQRLQRAGSLSCVVRYLALGAAGGLLSDCKRVCSGRLSLHTGGYCKARQNLPTLVVRRVTEEILAQLRPSGGRSWPGLEPPVFVLDGSTLQLDHSAELKRCYPPPSNQRGPSHWPLLRLVVFHELSSGLAQLPCWGPFCGEHAVSEQSLAEQAMDALPMGAVVLADRNFGIFQVAYAAQQRQHPVLLRLTEQRVRQWRDTLAPSTGAQAVEWRTSRQERRHHPGFPSTAVVSGRLICARLETGTSPTWLYLFTTLSLPTSELVALYGQRWHIEADLRSLKQTLRLHHLTAKTAQMTEKELLIAFSAYNLVRAVMTLAAQRAQLSPRQFSFTQVLGLVQDMLPLLANAATPAQASALWERLLSMAAYYKLPNRGAPRSFPRAQWPRRSAFPSRHSVS